mgnify:CR=1 FL=1
MSEVLRLLAVSAEFPEDPDVWFALADALQERGSEDTLERMTGRALVAMRALGFDDRAIDWVDWAEDGSSGVGSARDRPFVFRGGDVKWADDSPEEWTNSEGWEWRSTSVGWARLWGAQVHGDPYVPGYSYDMPIRGLDADDVLRQIGQDYGTHVVLRAMFRVGPVRADEPADYQWYRRVDGEWERCRAPQE